jgi:hypothetical protein
MAIQCSVALRNARLDAIPAYVGLGPILKIRDGAAPANCAAADSGTVLSTVVVPSDSPSDWMAAAASGAIAKSGVWDDTSADASGTAAHFRFYLANGTTCFMQGTVTATGGGGDMTVNSVTFTAGQSFTVTGFTLTDANA